MYVLFIWGLMCCHSNPVVKKCMSLFRSEITKVANIGMIYAFNVIFFSDLESTPGICFLNQFSAKWV